MNAKSVLTEVIAEDVPAPRGHFSHAVRSGSSIFVSGLLALDSDGVVIAQDDAAEQARQILAALEKVLQAAGSSKGQIAKFTIYLTDLDDRIAVGEARAEFMGEARPASTLVEVSGLAAVGARVEIEAIAAAG